MILLSRKLVESFESYAKNHGLDGWQKFKDFLFTVCQIDKVEGSNTKMMSIEKCLTVKSAMDLQEDEMSWTEILAKAGLSPIFGEVELPRVQRERLFLDYLLWVVFGVIKNGKMPCYCCESTPKAIDRAASASYKSEEELGEVFQIIAKEIGLISESDSWECRLTEMSLAYLSVLNSVVSAYDKLCSDGLLSVGNTLVKHGKVYKRESNSGEFVLSGIILPKSYESKFKHLKVEWVSDESFIERFESDMVIDGYCRACLCSFISMLVSKSWCSVSEAYKTKEYLANYAMIKFVSNFGDIMPVGTTSYDNIAPTIVQPVQMHPLARQKSVQLFSGNVDMLSSATVLGVFALLSTFCVENYKGVFTEASLRELLHMEEPYWRCIS